MSDKWMGNLAAATGLAYFPKQGPFGHKDGAVIGNRNGFLVAVGPAKIGNNAAISLLVRFPSTPQSDTVRASVEQFLSETPDVIKPAGKAKSCLTAAEGGLRWNWTYSFGKPKVEPVAALSAALVEGARKSTPPFDGKCETCHINSTPEILLLEGTPVYYCAGCQQQLEQKLREAGEAYETKPTNVLTGVLFGAGAAALGGIAWGLIAYFLKRIFLWGAIIIGNLVARAFFKGYGKIDNLGRVLVGVFTLASVLSGDALFYTLIGAREINANPSVAIFVAMVKVLWKLESESGNLLSPIFGLIGAALVVFSLSKPKFTATFERLGQPAR